MYSPTRQLRVAGLLLFMAGCGPSLGRPETVTGKITLSGMPVADANVTFYAQDNTLPAAVRTKSGTTDAQGAYSIAEVYPGEHQVRVEKIAYSADNPGSAPAEGPPADPLARFGGDSPLKAKVSAEETKFDFELANQ